MWITYKRRIKRLNYRVWNPMTDKSYYAHEEKTKPYYYEWVETTEWMGKLKYQKKAHHKKKTKSNKQLNKEAWREHKQMKRDKAKRQDLHGYRSDGCPVWLKRHCNKKHRQWERRCIEKGQYEKMGAKWQRKDFFDPWMWD